MSVQTVSTYRPAARRQDRADVFSVFALTLAFALAMLGLMHAAHPGADVENDEPTAVLMGP